MLDSMITTIVGLFCKEREYSGMFLITLKWFNKADFSCMESLKEHDVIPIILNIPSIRTKLTIAKSDPDPPIQNKFVIFEKKLSLTPKL